MTALLLLVSMAPALATETIPVKITTTQKIVSLQLELAATPDAREHGLMNRTKLAPLDGMLFQFPTPSDYAFWMKNTLIPLDMLFVNDAHKIVYIAPNAKPNSLDPIRSGQPNIVSVIELDGGRAAADGIAVGDGVDDAIPSGVQVQ